MTQLKLTALEPKDLEVLSAHLQDAIVRVGDITFLQGKKRFVMVVNRFDWERAENSGKKELRRRLCGLHFEGVQAVRRKKISPEKQDIVLELLSIEFKTGERPSGLVSLKFAAGAEIELNVEYVEALMNDLGPEWGARSMPQHDSDPA